MQKTRQDMLRAMRDQQAESERSLKEQALKSLRDYRIARTAQRRLVANTKAAA